MNETSRQPPSAGQEPSGRDLWESICREPFARNVKAPYVLGPYASFVQRDDPKHNLFTLARYKFCAKMLIGKRRLLEIGCADAFGLDIVRHEVKPERITGVDFDEPVIAFNRQRYAGDPEVEFLALDVTQNRLPGGYDGAWCTDVIEHIYPRDEHSFWDHVTASLTEDAVCIVGTPNAAANRYASPQSRRGHVNLKDGEALRMTMRERFENVFLFSMNDEVVHTGFTPMAHYLFAIGAGKR